LDWELICQTISIKPEKCIKVFLVFAVGEFEEWELRSRGKAQVAALSPYCY